MNIVMFIIVCFMIPIVGYAATWRCDFPSNQATVLNSVYPYGLNTVVQTEDLMVIWFGDCYVDVQDSANLPEPLRLSIKNYIENSAEHDFRCNVEQHKFGSDHFGGRVSEISARHQLISRNYPVINTNVSGRGIVGRNFALWVDKNYPNHVGVVYTGAPYQVENLAGIAVVGFYSVAVKDVIFNVPGDHYFANTLNFRLRYVVTIGGEGSALPPLRGDKAYESYTDATCTLEPLQLTIDAPVIIDFGSLPAKSQVLSTYGWLLRITSGSEMPANATFTLTSPNATPSGDIDVGGGIARTVMRDNGLAIRTGVSYPLTARDTIFDTTLTPGQQVGSGEARVTVTVTVN